jgi:hypothetical protein
MKTCGANSGRRNKGPGDMQIDWTISLGAIVNALVVAIGGVGMLFTMRAQLSMMNDRLTAPENEAKTQTQILIDVAKQEARQDGLERRFDDLVRRLDAKT